MVRAFQSATMALRYADVPVVVAPAGLALGGGCEIALHGDRVQAAAESYIGLVEVGVGLIPGRRRHEGDAGARDGAAAGAATDLLPFVQRVFETIGFAKVSTSAADARRLGYLRDGDGVTMNRERLMADAKAHGARARARGLSAAARRARRFRVGGDGVLAALKLGVHLAWRAGRISDHDALIGRELAHDPRRRRRCRIATTRQRAAPARPRARGVPEPLRRAQDARADPAHAEDRKAAEELTMHIIDDSGIAVAVRSCSIPGIQGRWEWMRPAVDALSRALPRHHASRCATSRGRSPRRPHARIRRLRRSGRRRRSTTPGIERAVDLRRLVRRPDRAALRRARIPSADRALVLASTPGPGWHLQPRHAAVLRGCRGCSGRCSSPRRRWRLRPRNARRVAGPRARGGDSRVRSCGRCCRAPLSLVADGGARAADRDASTRGRTAQRITAPTLVVTGEPRARPRRAGGRHRREYVRADSRRARRRARAHGPSRHRSRGRTRSPTIVREFVATGLRADRSPDAAA